jgi:hypothetical protein
VDALADNPPDSWRSVTEGQVDDQLGDELATRAEAIIRRELEGD